MTGISLVGYNNYVTLLNTSLTATSEAANMPATNLRTNQGGPSAAWQTISGTTTASFTITPTLTYQPWRAFGLFRTNLSSTASVTIRLYTQPATQQLSVQCSGPTPGYQQVVYPSSSDIYADYCTITIVDANNPDGFLNIPLAYAGPMWQPSIGMGFETTAGRDDQTDEIVSRAGQEYPQNRWQRRRWNLALDGVTNAEVWNYADKLNSVGRTGSNCLLIPNTTSTYGQREAVFGRWHSTSDITFAFGSADRRALRGSFVERL